VATLPAVLVTLVGVLLILSTLRDVFDTLFHPGGKATLSRVVMRTVWWVFHRLAPRWPRSFSLAGPIALILIIGAWASSLVLGWAFVYWPHIESGFSYQPGAHHAGVGGLLDSLYVSLVTLSTVGYGDVAPHADWLRIVTPVEALVGFGLLTASISWLAAIYPALSRRRSLAYEIHILRKAQEEIAKDVGDLDPATAGSVYSELTSRLVTVERDLTAFPIAYYFAEVDDRFALPSAMPFLYDVARRGAGEAVDDHARLRAVMLRDAIQEFADTAADRFHGDRGESTADALRAYARDHMRDPDTPREEAPEAAMRS
jgi:hypothetical protein